MQAEVTVSLPHREGVGRKLTPIKLVSGQAQKLSFAEHFWLDAYKKRWK
jgi:hypothetical protein